MDVQHYDLTVVRAIDLTPHMRRVTFTAPNLAGFRSVSPDQQVKIFLPPPGHDVPVIPPMPEDRDITTWYAAYLAMDDAIRPAMRTYTIRAHRDEPAELDIDFVLHDDAGPASAWAAGAVPGQRIAMVGPSVSHVRTPASYDWMLLAGDESALPAIAAVLETLPDGMYARVFVEVAGPQEEQLLETKADLDLTWVHRGPGDLLLRAVEQFAPPAGEPYVWLAGEAGAVRALRRHFVNDRGVPKSSIVFVGYWRRALSQDAPPTAEDLADATEQV
ncbi:siderophore-interacting protein [Nonomuraea sp. NPDC059194]|uniref:siderophore-interacting protein n=1 Tax=Nonomuraea sp. NPDC059194 TaxID=3346764 RepID=UPI0036CD01B4